MRKYLAALPSNPLNDHDSRENSSIHLKRYELVTRLVAVHPQVVRWLILNRWLEKEAIDPVIAPYNTASEFLLPVGVHGTVRQLVQEALKELKKRQTIHSEPILKEEGTQYIIQRRTGKKFTISVPLYERLKGEAELKGQFRLGPIFDLLCRYEPYDLDSFPREISYLDSYYQLLRTTYGIDTHLLSSPMSAYYTNYGSLYYDTDAYFGSLGCLMYANDPIVERIKAGGAFELTATLFGEFPQPVLMRLETLLSETKKPSRVICLLAGTVAWPGNENVVYNKYIEQSRHTLLVYESHWPEKFDPVPLEQYLMAAGQNDTEVVEIADNLKLTYPTPSMRTLPYLTIYEKAMAIGNRANQFVRGGIAQIEVGKEHDLLKIADMELRQKKMPITIRRVFPSGEYEDVQINSLYDPDLPAFAPRS